MSIRQVVRVGWVCLVVAWGHVPASGQEVPAPPQGALPLPPAPGDFPGDQPPVERVSGRFSQDSFTDLTSFAAGLMARPVVDPCRAHCDEARTHLAAGRWHDARRESTLAIQANPASYDAYHLQSDVYTAQSLYAHATATMTAAIAACPGDPRPWSRRGLYRCLDHDSGGLADFDEAFRSAGDHPEMVRWIESHRASAYFTLGDYRRCVEGFNRALSEESRSPNDFWTRSYALLALGEFERAVLDADHALQLVPTPDARMRRGYVRLRAGRFAEALADLEHSRTDFPAAVSVQTLLGLALLANGRVGDATTLLDDLLKANPDGGNVQCPPDRPGEPGRVIDGGAMTARGWLALLTGDFAKAQTLLTRAAGAPEGFLMSGLWFGDNRKNRDLDSTYAEFEARCRVAPSLPWAFIFLQGDAARCNAKPRREFVASFVCRLAPDPGQQPMLTFTVFADHHEQAWKGYAVLGELVAAACLRDRVKLVEALDNLRHWAEGAKSLGDELRAEFGRS